MDTSEYTYSFTFGTKEPLSFEAYKASDSYNTSSNSGAVWRWQYRNDDVLYTDLTSVGSYGTHSLHILLHRVIQRVIFAEYTAKNRRSLAYNQNQQHSDERRY